MILESQERRLSCGERKVLLTVWIGLWGIVFVDDFSFWCVASVVTLIGKVPVMMGVWHMILEKVSRSTHVSLSTPLFEVFVMRLREEIMWLYEINLKCHYEQSYHVGPAGTSYWSREGRSWFIVFRWGQKKLFLLKLLVFAQNGIRYEVLLRRKLCSKESSTPTTTGNRTRRNQQKTTTNSKGYLKQ